MSRYPQVKNLDSIEALVAHLTELGVHIPVDAVVDPGGVLSTPTEVRDRAGSLTVANRFAVLPMEGWDATDDGRPTDLVRRRWSRFGESGCGLVWGEATAVRAEGRANPNQMVLDEGTAGDLATLRGLLDDHQVVGLQLTHSGRWSRPRGQAQPRVAYRHPLLDERVGADEHSVLTDDELEGLVEDYVAAAVLARQGGFDFVDVKHCHGYLLHELLSARDRPGRYGGDLAGRSAFLREVVAGIRSRVPGLAVAVRLSAFDLVPYEPGPDGVGAPATTDPYPYAFGGDGTDGGIDLSEPHELLAAVAELGVNLVSITGGSPYYNPHVQRPAYFPPSDGYKPPEDPLVGVARQLAVTAAIARGHPDLVVVGSGYSYLQEWLPNVAQAVVARGGASIVGLGRMVLSYPQLAADVLAGREIDRRLVCRTFSDCTTAPRNGLVSGCYPLDEFYKDRPERVSLAKAKKTARDRLR